MNNKLIDVIEYVNELDLDIVAVQETWFNEDELTKLVEIQELGYNVLSKPRKRRGGGLLILYKSFLAIKLVSTNDKYKTFELMEATFKLKSVICISI